VTAMVMIGRKGQPPNPDFLLRMTWFRSGTGRTDRKAAVRREENIGQQKPNMKTQHSIIIGSLAFILLAACPAGAQWVRWEPSAGGNGHWYQAVRNTNAANWTQVNELARAEGGYLATITSAAENAFVFSLVDFPEFFQAVGGGAGPAIGGFQPDGSPEPGGGWTWVTGEAWGYSNWAPPGHGFPQMPDNAGGKVNENRLHFFSGAQGVPAPTWNDLPDWDANLGGYVVERDTAPPGVVSLGLRSLGGDVMQSNIAPRPSLSIHPGGEVSWTTVTNVHYQLQWAASVNSTNWMNLDPAVLGTGETVRTFDRTTGEQQRFYRVLILP
jgi:hypothetical protein